MRHDHLTLRMALGGAVWGILLGSFGGAFVGTCFGLLADNLSYALDAALLGGFGLGVAGAVYALVLHFTDGLPPALSSREPNQEEVHSFPSVRNR